MGFDYVDKQHAPKPLVRLECVWCGSTHNDVAMARPVYAGPETEGQAMCRRCLTTVPHFTTHHWGARGS